MYACSVCVYEKGKNKLRRKKEEARIPNTTTSFMCTLKETEKNGQAQCCTRWLLFLFLLYVFLILFCAFVMSHVYTMSFFGCIQLSMYMLWNCMQRALCYQSFTKKNAMKEHVRCASHVTANVR